MSDKCIAEILDIKEFYKRSKAFGQYGKFEEKRTFDEKRQTGKKANASTPLEDVATTFQEIV